MNEGMTIYLNFEEKEAHKMEPLIQRIDNLLENFGMKYAGFANYYVPIQCEERDHTVYVAMQALKGVTWLKDMLAYVFVSHNISAHPIEKIDVSRMSEPTPEKLKYYEDYYLENKKLAHAIVVNEKGEIRDGYISYLLAQKYNILAEVLEAFQKQPLKKIVLGRHVQLCEGKWKVKSDRCYCWSYNLDKAVVPGDILQVITRKGIAHMQVDEIRYVTGKEFCNEYFKVKKHMGVRNKLG